LSQRRIVGVAALPCGQMVRVDITDDVVCLAHTGDGRYFAIADTCSHGKASLSDGWLEGTEVKCPKHQSVFSLESGDPLTAPAILPQRTYTVAVDGDDILLEPSP
jgi:3-phenylpropionate/trans-cinnamate dioxygenase ferredoxin component